MCSFSVVVLSILCTAVAFTKNECTDHDDDDDVIIIDRYWLLICTLKRLTKFSQQNHEVDIIVTPFKNGRLTDKFSDLPMATKPEGG